MKKFILATSFIVAGSMLANAETTLFDSFSFDASVQSELGKAFTLQQASVSYATEEERTYLNLNLTYNSVSGMYLNDSNAYSLTSNWAVQFDVSYTNSTGTAQKLFDTSNSNGLYVGATNSTEGSTYALASGTAFTSWENKILNQTVGGQGEWTTISLINLNGDVSFYIGTTKIGVFSSESAPLTKMMFGFGSGGNQGCSAGTVKLDDLKIYTISSGDSRVSVEKALSVPEPSAFGLLAGVGALALVVSRRRRR